MNNNHTSKLNFYLSNNQFSDISTSFSVAYECFMPSFMREAPRYHSCECHPLRCCLRLQRIPLKRTPMKAVFVPPLQISRRSKDLLTIQDPRTEYLVLDYRRGLT